MAKVPCAHCGLVSKVEILENADCSLRCQGCGNLSAVRNTSDSKDYDNAAKYCCFAFVLLIIGLGITFVTYSMVAETGGTYYIVYGPVIGGIYYLFKACIAYGSNSPEVTAIDEHVDTTDPDGTIGLV